MQCAELLPVRVLQLIQLVLLLIFVLQSFSLSVVRVLRFDELIIANYFIIASIISNYFII